MAAFVVPVVPPRAATAALPSGSPRRRRRRGPLRVVAAVVPVGRTAGPFEPEPLVAGGAGSGGSGGGGGGGGSSGGGRWRGSTDGASVEAVAAGRVAPPPLPLTDPDAETVGTFRLAAASGSPPAPTPSLPRNGAVASPTAAGGSTATEDADDDVDADGDDAPPDEKATTVWTGRKHTASARAKISAANRGRVPWNKGRQHSEETRARIAAATRAAMNRPEVRNRMADKTVGRKHTPETRAKIRASCTARFHGRKDDDDVAAEATAVPAAATAAAAAATSAAVATSAAGDASWEGAPEQQTAAEATLAAGRGVAAAANRPRTSVARQPTSSDTSALPFSYDNAELGPRVLSSLAPAGRTGDAGTGTAWLAADDVSSAGGGRGTMPKRGPLSAETRAKLSRRIRDMWANDADYRARVTAGIASRATGRVRQLSAEHREAIRQSLLSRNAALREQGVAHPSTRYAEGEDRPRRRVAAADLTPAEAAARADARRAKRAAREAKRLARRAARAEEVAARRQSQKALVSQLVSAGSLPPLETLAQLDGWSGEPSAEGGAPADDGERVTGGWGDGGAPTGGAGGRPDAAQDFEAIRAGGVHLQGRLRGEPEGALNGGGHGVGAAAAAAADAPPLDLPPDVLVERIDYGDQLSFDLTATPVTPEAEDLLSTIGGDANDELLPAFSAGAPAQEPSAVDGEEDDDDSDSELDDDEEWDDEDEDEDEEDEADEEFDLTWEYEVEPAPQRAPPKSSGVAPVRKRILTYVNGAATMVDGPP